MGRIGYVVGSLSLFASSVAFASTPTPMPVVGGSDVPAGKWRDTAAVYFGGGEPGCTGTLIAPNLVLTAGHCIGGIDKIMVGSNTLSGGGEFISVQREIEYPNSWGTYDIGLLVLAQDSSVEPRVIVNDCILEEELADGASVAVVGWGAINTNGGGSTSTLKEAFTTITDHDCTDIQRGCNSSVSPNGELGAGGEGVDSCFGDSGGPLYLLTDRGDYLVGVTSRGYDIGGQPCGQGGIYVRPDAIFDWIEQTSGVTLSRPVCNLAPEPTATVPQIVVTAGESESTTIEPHDPDVADTHSFSVATAPEYGEVTIDANGVATYAADRDYEGLDSFVVAVADSGSPSLSGTVLVQVEVLPAPDDCGCRAAHTGGAGTWALMALAALGVVRRRRRA